MRQIWFVCAMLLTAVVGISLLNSAPAQVTKGKKRLAETKYLMRGLTQPTCAGLWKALKDGPADDKAWDNVVCAAACLNEVGNFLMDDGRCPDAAWANACKSLREGTAALEAAAQKKDLEAARKAFGTVTGSCGACHKVHKK